MWKNMSKMRLNYFLRLLARIAVLLISFVVWLWKPETFDLILGFNFFKKLSPLHLLWAIWVFDMILQLFPLKAQMSIALGSKKLFGGYFKPSDLLRPATLTQDVLKPAIEPIVERVNLPALKKYIISTGKSALLVVVLWVALIAAIATLYFLGFIDHRVMFLLTCVFYVCDLICVLIWCPFRLILKNRCCTTCRIFNWDHIMMFSPLLFVPGFFTWSLSLLAIAAVALWEIMICLYPERFWEMTNDALKCSNCTDKLCTQYCQKLRK